MTSRILKFTAPALGAVALLLTGCSGGGGGGTLPSGGGDGGSALFSQRDAEAGSPRKPSMKGGVREAKPTMTSYQQ